MFSFISSAPYASVPHSFGCQIPTFMELVDVKTTKTEEAHSPILIMCEEIDDVCPVTGGGMWRIQFTTFCAILSDLDLITDRSSRVQRRESLRKISHVSEALKDRM